LLDMAEAEKNADAKRYCISRVQEASKKK